MTLEFDAVFVAGNQLPTLAGHIILRIVPGRVQIHSLAVEIDPNLLTGVYTIGRNRPVNGIHVGAGRDKGSHCRAGQRQTGGRILATGKLYCGGYTHRECAQINRLHSFRRTVVTTTGGIFGPLGHECDQAIPVCMYIQCRGSRHQRVVVWCKVAIFILYTHHPANKGMAAPPGIGNGSIVAHALINGDRICITIGIPAFICSGNGKHAAICIESNGIRGRTAAYTGPAGLEGGVTADCIGQYFRSGIQRHVRMNCPAQGISILIRKHNGVTLRTQGGSHGYADSNLQIWACHRKIIAIAKGNGFAVAKDGNRCGSTFCHNGLRGQQGKHQTQRQQQG